MIKLIQKGTRKRLNCDFCGCLFSYEDEDIETHNVTYIGVQEIVKCPQCGENIILSQTREVT